MALITAPSVEVAESLVRALLDEELIACGNIVPGVRSIYRWQGAVECETEALILMKTTAALVPQLLKRAPELHPYEVPEVLVMDVPVGHPPYLRWVETSVAEFVGKNDAEA